MNALNRYGPLVARILLATLFILSGASKLGGGFDGTVGYIASKGLPLPALGAILAIAVELGGGLLLVAGYRARLVAVVMFVFTGAAAILFHNFWAETGPGVMMDQVMFLKNFSIMGGLLMVVLHGSGPLSLGNDD